MAVTRTERWPSIPVVDWQDTRDTLQLYTQIVGKIRLANEPLANHWWNVPLYVTARGLTTSLMPHSTGPAFQIDFDFVARRLDVVTVAGEARSLDLVPRPVPEFYEAVMSMLGDLGVGTEIWPVPVEIPDAIPFSDDGVHASYDAEAVHRFWRALVDMERVLKVFRSRFVGKVQSRALLLGSPGHGLYAVLRADRAAPSGRSPELRSACDVGGVLARGEQLRVLAGTAGRGRRVLRLRLPGAAGLPRGGGVAIRCPLG
jgi:hypothetical protein